MRDIHWPAAVFVAAFELLAATARVGNSKSPSLGTIL